MITCQSLFLQLPCYRAKEEQFLLDPIEEVASCFLDPTMCKALFNNLLNLSTPTTDVKGRDILTYLSDRAADRMDKQSVGPAEVVVRKSVCGVVEISPMVVATLVLLEFEQSAGTHSSSSSLRWT